MKWIWLLMLWPITGCLQLLQTPVVEAPCLPGRQQYRHGCLVIHDDTGVHRNHPLFAELAHFPEEVCRVLKLPVQDGLIHVYLFPDQTSFDTYLLAFYPEVTKRRALFIKRPSAVLGGQEELQILCFWGDDIAAQLRHELTHATLHGLRLRLPLWLDEGLAMYFEVGSAGALHREALEAWEKEPWQFDLSRLQELQQPGDMGRRDYYEAWAWTHYLMHHSTEHRRALLRYLHTQLGSKIANWNIETLSDELPIYMQRMQSQRSHWPGTVGAKPLEQ